MSHRFFVLGFHSLVAVGLLAGCGPTDDPVNEELGRAELNIQGGYPDPGDPATVGIIDQGGGACTGSLIAPNVVLTARHCVSATLNDDQGVDCVQTTFGSPHNANNFYVTTKQYFTQNPSDYHTVLQVITLPDVGTSFCGKDQAILILDNNIDPSEATPYVPRVDTEIAPGDEYYAIGYGQTSDTNYNSAGQRRRRDGLFVDCVALDCPPFKARETEWTGDTGICSGDSGGPALDLKNRVIGVTSRGPAGCENPVYGYVFGWGQWIKDTVIYAAGLGGYSPPPWANGWPTDPEYSMPMGELCSQPSECVSGRCVNDGFNSYCTRLCNEAAPCPQGFSCDAANQVCLQDHDAPKPKEKPAVVEDTGCTLAPTADPTKPIPWFTGAFAVLALAGLLRRRRDPR